MHEISDRKLHFAPLSRQQKAIDRLIKSGRFRNVTALMRAALDHYLDRIGRPTLASQARDMAEDWVAAGAAGRSDSDRLQAASMDDDEAW